MYNEHWFGGGFMWIFFIAIIFLIFWGNRLLNERRVSEKPEQQSALDILKTRYASGEIDQTEYKAKKQDLV